MFRQAAVKVGTLVAILMIGMAAPVTAEVIAITGGTAVIQRGADELHIKGTRGFRLDAGLFSPPAFYVPELMCFGGQECQPGTVVPLDGVFSGGDVSGEAQLRGKTYPDIGSAASRNQAHLEFSGEVTMPPLTEGPISIRVPFEFAGLFFYAPDMVSEQQQALLTGGGFVTLTFDPYPAGNAWIFQRAEYEFRPVKR
jgi:hypothetical protein